MNDFSTYERFIQQKNTGKIIGKKIAMILLYLCWIGIFLWIMGFWGIHPAILLLIPISTGALILLTWKYVQVEFEYVIVGGSFQVTKIYGKRKRKLLLEIELKDALLIAPYTEGSMERAERLSPEETVMAISSADSDTIWLLVYEEDEKETRVLLFFEADDTTIRLLRRNNPHATVRL